MRYVMSRLLVLGIVAAMAPASQACWWPFFPAYYGAGYAPWAAPYNTYGAGYYGGYQPQTVSYAPSYSSATYSVGYGSFPSNGCAVSCCDPCSSCGTSCGNSCLGGSCGAACGGVDSGSLLRPTTDPISNTGTGRSRDPEDPDERDRRDGRDPLDNRRDLDRPRDYEDRMNDDSGRTDTFDRDGNAPLFDDDNSDRRFGPNDGSTGIGSDREDWRRNRSLEDSSVPPSRSGEDADSIFERLDDAIPGTRRTQRPITTPVDEDAPTDGDSAGTSEDSDENAPTPPESDLGKEVSPEDFLAPPSGTEKSTDEDQAVVPPLMLTHSRLRSSHFDVRSSRRLAAESREKKADTQLSDSATRQRTLRWISVPAPAGRVRL